MSCACSVARHVGHVHIRMSRNHAQKRVIASRGASRLRTGAAAKDNIAIMVNSCTGKVRPSIASFHNLPRLN
jgi:hypothetical protein